MIETSKLRFLVIDDDTGVREMAGTFLKIYFKGCSIEELTDGTDFENYDGSAHFYVCDNNMPTKNGIDALLSRRESGDKTPTIIISGLLEELIKDLNSRRQPIPANTYLLKKPCSYKEFTATIDTALKAYYTDNLEPKAVNNDSGANNPLPSSA